MGYTLKIGQAITYTDPETGVERIDCEKVFMEDAPAFGEVTDHTNVRMPSYSAWEDLAIASGLYDFFFDPGYGLLNTPDGVTVLSIVHKTAIDLACADYAQKHPTLFSVKNEASLSVEDYHFERLRWLKFWIDWALKNCSSAVFVNEQ